MHELERVEQREGLDGIVKYAMKMAEGIVPMEGDKPYFPKTAREFLQGLILHVYTTEPKEKRNLATVRDLLTRGYPESKHPFEFLLHQMQRNKAFSGVIANAGATMAGTGRSAGDVLSTARSATKFLDLPEIRNISSGSDFSLEDLKTGSLNLFVCAPTGSIRVELSGWFRLLTVLALDLFEKIPGNLEEPCLFAIDEMPSLGQIEAIETSAPVMRSYGVRLVAISQDLERLQAAYPKGWRGFLGNADAVYWMATNEDETAEYLSKSLGSQRIKQRAGWIPFFKSVIGQSDEPLLTPAQVKLVLDPDRNVMIVTRFGKKSIRSMTMPYYKELPVYFYEPDREYKEPHTRAFSRKLFASQSVSTVSSGIVPNNSTGSLTYADSKHLFGAQEPFTIFELEKRRSLLTQRLPKNAQYLGMLDSAFSLLKARART